MYQKDFILRMVDMIADLVAGILGLIKKGDYEKATQSLENAFHDFLKEDASFFRNISKSELTDKLLNEHNYANGHLEILSELFYTQAELSYAQENYDESVEFYEKSLILLEFVVNETQTFSFEKQSKITLIQNNISDLTKNNS